MLTTIILGILCSLIAAEISRAIHNRSDKHS